MACKLNYMSILVMNASTMTCMDNHTITRRVIWGISEKLNSCDQFDML